MKAYHVAAPIQPMSIKELVGKEYTRVLIQTSDNPSPVYVGDDKSQPFKMMPNTSQEFEADVYIKGDGIGKVAILSTS